MTILTIISFVLIVGFLIFIHRGGHFVVGRAFYGADQHSDLDLSFTHLSVWARITIVLAGPAANFLLAVLLFWIVFAFVGRPVPSVSTNVGLVMEGFPAAEAGIVVGDRIVAVNGEPVESWEEMTKRIHTRPRQNVRLTVERREKRFETILTPSRSTQQNVAGRTLTIGLIGIHPSEGLVYERLDPLTALVEAGKRSFSAILTIFQSVWKTMAGALSSQVTGGPIPMVQMIAPQVEQGSFSMIIFTALLSINLGVLNLLPLPFLDGGRLCFLVVEFLRGRPVSLTVQRTVQWLIVALLVALMMLAVYLAFRDEIFQFLKTL